MGNIPISNKKIYPVIFTIAIIMTFHSICLGSDNILQYNKWKVTGRLAADKALALIKDAASELKKENLIVLTNAGYSEIDGVSTQGALDGAAEVTGVSRGRNTLVEVHSAPWAPLWLAVFDKGSGYCTYLEVNSAGKEKFGAVSIEKINAEYLYAHASEYNEKFRKKMFGGNEFRILTIANAVAKGAPASVVRTVEFHDHYCPGINSGIFMANYIKKNFPPDDQGYFIQSVTPWCKEDAFQVMLNVTLGKKSYSIYHPSDSDIEAREKELKDINTVVYRHDKKSGRWQGIALVFNWADKKAVSTGSSLIDKVRDSLWYLDNIDKPEKFVKIARSFDLPKGVAPVEWARPGIDPLKKISTSGN